MVKVGDIVAWMDEWARPALAIDGDPVGLQLGDPAKPVTKVLATLELTPVVAEEAVARGAQLVVSHHAVLYRPADRIREDDPAGRMLRRLIQADVAVYNAHTNLDVAPGGVNDQLVERLGLVDVEVLAPTRHERMFKLAVFVPVDHHRQVLDAVCSAGAGWIGGYSSCTFNIPGKGTFKPEEGANPYIGSVGKLEEVDEIRLETVVPADRLNAVVDAMLAAHPYEEVAYDVYPLERPVKTFGIGRIGTLAKPMALKELAVFIKDRLDAPGVRFCGDASQRVSRLAVLGGSGMGWAEEARKKGADAFLTGDVKHHDALDALAAGLPVIDAGHYSTERWIVPVIVAYLQARAAARGALVEVFPSDRIREPFAFV
ncbi:Nif3-like dinuclear metal center hexameric protein [Kyrpidia spormannii]|uniref:GTP cyclohydrolase n=1 Tax=Kyrpidia spormannii TaxID=2055160 RepID=A0ACA8Z7N8_9BACL|nr:Nif3-like dinuclear metal center hexameric protein [Kyrpidia spormannii]CAB3391246.1 putative GTP cyclohydrolase [Kyrpidia spormannii]